MCFNYIINWYKYLLCTKNTHYTDMNYYPFCDQQGQGQGPSSPLKNPIQPTHDPQVYWKTYAEQQDIV